MSSWAEVVAHLKLVPWEAEAEVQHEAEACSWTGAGEEQSHGWAEEEVHVAGRRRAVEHQISAPVPHPQLASLVAEAGVEGQEQEAPAPNERFQGGRTFQHRQ